MPVPISGISTDARLSILPSIMLLARPVAVAQHLAVRDVAVAAQEPAAEVPEALRALPFRQFLVQPQPEQEHNLLPVEAVHLAVPARLVVLRHRAAAVVVLAVVAEVVVAALHPAALRQAVAAVVSVVVAFAVAEAVQPQFQASRSSTCCWLPVWM